MGLFSRKRDELPAGWKVEEEDEDTRLVSNTRQRCKGLEMTVYQRVSKHGRTEEYYCGLCECFMPLSHFPH